jgi:hypothetical protein
MPLPSERSISHLDLVTMTPQRHAHVADSVIHFHTDWISACL